MFDKETQKQGQELLSKSFHTEDEEQGKGKGIDSTAIIDDEDPPMECTLKFCWAEFK
jgi:hypothetical protein